MKKADRQLLYCAENGDFTGVVSAIDAGADVNIRDNDGITALMWAAYWGRAKIAARLIRAGADMDIQYKDDWTALMWTARWGYIKAADIFIQAGANLFIKDKNGRTASDIAREHGYTRIAKLIEQQMAEQKRAELVRSIESVEMHDMSRWL